MKNCKFNMDKILSLRASGIALALVFMMPLAGCGKKDFKEYSFNTILESLHENDDITNIDNYLLNDDHYFSEDEKSSIEDFDNLFFQAYEQEDEELCNKLIYTLSKKIIKAHIAEGYSIDFDKIKDFDVIGLRRKTEFVEEYLKSEYGVSFKYEGKEYNLEANNHMARWACCVCRAAMKNQLTFYAAGDTENFSIKNAYDTMKKLLACSVEPVSGKHENSYDYRGKHRVGYDFDGFFALEDDKVKINIINNSIPDGKKLQILKQSNNPENKLPRK